MQPLLTINEMREAERQTVAFGTPESELMQRAASAVVTALQNKFGAKLPKTSGAVFAGPGRNGGDARIAAVLLEKLGCTVEVLGEGARLRRGYDFVIDGIFGIGLARDIEGEWKSTIESLNSAKNTYVVSVDIPSGLHADTGAVLGIAVKANETVTFGCAKRGLVTGSAADHVGKLTIADVGISPPKTVGAYLFGEDDAKQTLPRRAKSGHKGLYGHVYTVAGEPEKQGACILAAVAALRAGAGLSTVFGSKERVEALSSRLPPEIMVANSFPEGNAKGVVIVAGPGMGITPVSAGILREVLASKHRLVLDADALTLIARDRDLQRLLHSRFAAVCEAAACATPHPKEAAALLDSTADEVQSNRFKACEKLTQKFNCTIILKGNGTLIGHPGRPVLLTRTGDSSLSKGGTGDILSGLTATFLAQIEDSQQAAALSTYLHGRAAEILSEKLGSERVAFASDIAETFAEVVRELENPL